MACTSCGKPDKKLRDGLCPACFGLGVKQSAVTVSNSVLTDSTIHAETLSENPVTERLAEESRVNTTHKGAEVSNSVLVDSVIQTQTHHHYGQKAVRPITFQTREAGVEIYLVDEHGQPHSQGKTKLEFGDNQRTVKLPWKKGRYSFLLRKQGCYEAVKTRDITDHTSVIPFDYPTEEHCKPPGSSPERALLTLDNGRKIFLIAGKEIGFGRATSTLNPKVLLTLTPFAKGDKASLKSRARKISRHHGTLRLNKTSVQITDSSANGTTYSELEAEGAQTQLNKEKWTKLPEESHLNLGNGGLFLRVRQLKSNEEITGILISRPEEDCLNEYLLLRSACFLGFDESDQLKANPDEFHTPVVFLSFAKERYDLTNISEHCAVSINGKALGQDQKEPLKDGDQIKIWNTELVFQTACDADFY